MTQTAAIVGPAARAELAPVNPLERIETIDILRGFALFGVLICNMKGFSLPHQAYFGGVDWPGLSPLDIAIDRFILFALKEKFMSLFSFLFGLGLAVQLTRAQARGVSVVPRYIRRLVVLFLIGMAHAWFFWSGDILHDYALIGFLLLALRNVSVKNLERGFVIFLMVMLLGTFVLNVVIPRNPPDAARSAQRKQETEKGMQEQMKLYTQASYLEQVRSRMKPGAGGNIVPLTLELLSLFVMGLYAGKRGVFHDVEGNRAFIKKCMWVGLACGVGGLMMFVPPNPPQPWLRFIRTMLAKGTNHYFFLFYAAGLVLLIHRPDPTWRRRLAFLGPVGRMALTNYLMQTVIATTIFYNYGLGYYGKMGSAWGLVLSAAIFMLQVWLSAWWLRRYQFGPMEWVWRSLTYGKMQPMKGSSLPPAAVVAV